MTSPERATQVYQILIGAAHNRQILTYQIVAELIGVPRQGLAPHLARIYDFCNREGLPPLTILVVQAESGRPGSGFEATESLDRERERVFRHEWYRMHPPNAETFSG